MAVIIYLPLDGAQSMAGPASGGAVATTAAGKAAVASAGAGPPAPLNLRAAIFGGGITIVSHPGSAQQGHAPAVANEPVVFGDQS